MASVLLFLRVRTILFAMFSATAPFPSADTASSPQDAEQHWFHARLSRFNANRLLPRLPPPDWRGELRSQQPMLVEEAEFVYRERCLVSARAAQAPTEPDAFLHWFRELSVSGPGQGDSFFSWLRSSANLAEMRWFLTQEAAGEAGFDDLVAMTQVRFPIRAKLEMARNYWDEMGRGHEGGMHGPMLGAVVTELDLEPAIESTVWESLALANLMVALAANRQFAYHAVGALGVIEMTAPGRVSQVSEGLKRLAASTKARLYFQLHAGLDVKHSEEWNREVIVPLVEADPEVASAIAEGALMRLACGARCFRRYRAQFGFSC